MLTDHPWLAADPTLGPWQLTSDLDVVHTGAWILPDERPLPDELVAFLDAWHATGVRGLRQYARPDRRRPGRHRGDPRAGPPCIGLPRLGLASP